MPYITQAARVRAAHAPLTEGELNYAITCMIQTWMLDTGGVSYAKLNAAIGVLECAKLELYRRVAAPYEDTKCNENGDVYTCL